MHILKTTLLLLMITSVINTSKAQAPDFSALCKKEMEKLSFFAGDWKGEAIYQMHGVRHKR